VGSGSRPRRDPRRRSSDAGALSVEETERVDRIEAGEPSSGPVRFALEVDDADQTAEALVGAGGTRAGGPVVTPWNHRNVRIRAPDGMQLTLFTVLDGGS
jgi:glyoxalase/bleomycin resistance protein/dioxygenase superfamily protein